MLKVILACYTEFEERVNIVEKGKVRSSAYDVVKAFVSGKVGKFTSTDVIASCPSIGRSAALSAIKRLTDEKEIIKIGAGRATCYVRADSADDDSII